MNSIQSLVDMVCTEARQGRLVSLGNRLGSVWIPVGDSRLRGAAEEIAKELLEEGMRGTGTTEPGGLLDAEWFEREGEETFYPVWDLPAGFMHQGGLMKAHEILAQLAVIIEKAADVSKAAADLAGEITASGFVPGPADPGPTITDLAPYLLVNATNMTLGMQTFWLTDSPDGSEPGGQLFVRTTDDEPRTPPVRTEPFVIEAKVPLGELKRFETSVPGLASFEVGRQRDWLEVPIETEAIRIVAGAERSDWIPVPHVVKQHATTDTRPPA